MPLSFPPGPTPGQQYVGDGVTYQFDGTRNAWVKLSPVQSALAGAAAKTGAALTPGGDDGERPATPSTGMFRYNDTTAPAVMEYYDGTNWVDLAVAGGGGALGDWTVNTIQNSFLTKGVAYGNGKFVAVGGIAPMTGNMLASVSTDGYTWSTPTLVSASLVAGASIRFTFVNGVFFLSGGTRTYTSTDGVSWNTGAALASSISRIAGGNGKFVAICANVSPALFFNSSDGLNWTPSTVNASLGTTPTAGLAYFNANTFVFGADDFYIYVSTDGGATFPTRTLVVSGSIPSPWQSDGTNLVIEAGGGLYKTSNLTSFTAINFGGVGTPPVTCPSGTLIGSAAVSGSNNQGLVLTTDTFANYSISPGPYTLLQSVAFDGTTVVISGVQNGVAIAKYA
jgi:hypothetical protein